MPEEEYSERIKAIGYKIKELRIKAGYTSYEKFAIENDFESRQYWRLENGQNLTIKTLMKITDAHKITLEEFFNGFTSFVKSKKG